MRWEYKSLSLAGDELESLNELGSRGWEFAFIRPGTEDWQAPVAYFKRPIKEKEEVYTLHPSGEILPKENAHFNRLMEEKKRHKELLFQFRSMVLELMEADNAEVRKRAYLLIDSCYDDNGELIA